MALLLLEKDRERERDKMGIDAMRIRVQVRKFSVIYFRSCYRSVCKHPFLVGMVCYLFLLYSSFPVLFSLLVSASPVLICSAILLGTLLSFGEPNVPEIEMEKEGEEEVSHEISSFKKEGFVEDATFVAQKDESFILERVVGNIDIEEESLVEKNNRMIEVHGDLGEYVSLIDETLWEAQFEKQVIEEVKSDFDNLESAKKGEIQDENLEIKEGSSHEEGADNQYSLLQNFSDENLEDDNSMVEFIGTQNGYLEFSQESSWKCANHDDEVKDDEASDFGFDGVGNSSPDASMADILPILDELHSLLDEEAPRPAHISHDGSDAGSEGSHKSDESSTVSEEDLENQANEDEDGDDDNENEEEAKGSKEDESKSAIKWTDDDQKNLMDLGTLEIERNLRLESLITRRRARRSMRLMAEKNLIDLDAADLPINVPSISTARQNPFDFPYDDVPGSAPSVLLPRQNPFDLPNGSNEEKSDLKVDSFQQEVSTTQHREPFFRRHESFSVRSSTLGGARQEKQDLWWKPFFVPERFTTEGTSYHTFQRQLSEASDSKVSSVPDSESVSSVLKEDKRINEVNVSHKTEMISNVDHASLLFELGSLSSEEVDSVDDEQVEEGDFHHDGAEITPGNFEDHHEVDSCLSEFEGETPKELNPSEILLRMEPGEEDYSSRSSLSSLSEIDEKITDVRRGSMCLEAEDFQIECSHISTQTSLDSDFHFVSGLADDNEHRVPILESRNDHVNACDISTQSSLDSDFHFTSRMMDESSHQKPALESTGYQIVDSGILTESSPESDIMSGLEDDNQEHVLEPRGHHNVESVFSSHTTHNSDFHLTTAVVDDGQDSDPVYDSSSPSIETFLTFSSISSDTHRSEMGSPLAMVEDKESEAHVESLETGTSGYKELFEGSSHAQSPDESKLRSIVTENTGDEIPELGLSEVCSIFYGQNGVMKPESAVENVSVNSLASLSEIIFDGIKQLNFASSSYKMASEESNLPVLEKDYPPPVVEQVSADIELSATEDKPVKDHGLVTEKNLGLEQDQVNSSGFNVDIQVDGFQAVDEKLDLVDSNSHLVPSNNSHLSAHEERQPAVVGEHVFGNYLDLSSSETKHVEENSLKKGKTIQFKQDQVHLPSSDTTIGAGFQQDVDLTVVSLDSGHHNPLSGEKSHLESEKQQSLSDKSMLKPRELSVSISNNKNILKLYDPEEKMSDFTSDSPDSLEYKSTDGGMNMKDHVLHKIVYEDCHPVLEHSNSPGETYGPPMAEDTVNEVEDEMKEIDEELLSELDTVGDLSVKEVAGESLHDEQVPENTSVSPEFNFLPKNSSQMEVKPELPVLAVGSVEDIDLALKQPHEGLNVEEVIHPSMVEEQLAEDESKLQTKSNLRVVEARSLEDIHIAMKLVSEENFEELVDSRDVTAEVNDLASTKEILVLEAKTIEDIDMAFRQLHEGMEVISIDSRDSQKNEEDTTEDIESSTVEVIGVNSTKSVESSSVQVTEVASIKESEPGTTEFGFGETSTFAPHEPKHGFNEAY
ncbi:hypothetical protein SADUNF_Sadunf19G0051700 [Salix dunnii]|uniref:Uncharacterized protein n=1 Tax=Salix dunnii TaxID=1413687 RepID=A0A835MCK0_9ROSI|nr:hypothetical protein SADUNF_Sadunf19G0051700 [Salix dunnii]